MTFSRRVSWFVLLCVAGRGDIQPQLDSAMQDVSDKYILLEETEKQAVRRALTEERGRFCAFVSMLKPVVVSGFSTKISKIRITFCCFSWDEKWQQFLREATLAFFFFTDFLSRHRSGWRNVYAGRDHSPADHSWWPEGFDYGPPQTATCQWAGL